MKYKNPIRIVLALVAVTTIAIVVGAGPRDAEWKKVNEAVNKGLPKTAIELLQPIIDQAIRDKAYPEAIKAIAKKIALEGNIQGNKPEEKITRMQAEVEKAPAEMKPMMEALLANWYWHFFQQNRYRFMHRTMTGESPGGDIMTWDLPRILGEIDKQFVKALSHEKELKATPIATYDALLEKGSVSDNYRPTLYDFVVHDALAFYSTPEQAGSKADDTFELLATMPIFAPANEFRKWEINTTDAESRIVKAIKLYQQLLQFHEKDTDQSAYLDADLLRLHFGYQTAFGDEKKATYKAVLKQFADKNAKHELSSQALYDLAVVMQSEGDLVEAHRLAQQGEKAFPKSVGGIQCFNLIWQIEMPAIGISTERSLEQADGRHQR